MLLFSLGALNGGNSSDTGDLDRGYVVAVIGRLVSVRGTNPHFHILNRGVGSVAVKPGRISKGTVLDDFPKLILAGTAQRIVENCLRAVETAISDLARCRRRGAARADQTR